MCHSHVRGACLGCSCALSRRGFVKACGAAVAAAGGLAPRLVLGELAGLTKVRVGLVFLSRKDASWPWPGFDVEAREHEVTRLLAEGCPGVEFIPTPVRTPDEVKKAVALADGVDGFLIYTLSLAWNLQRTLVAIAKLGKPTVVADEFLGGSGVFLRGYSELCRQSIPAAAVASTRPDDLVAVARCFATVKQPGTTPASFARHCQEVYRRTFAEPGDMKCLDDPLKPADIGQCVERFKKSRFLIVGTGKSGRKESFLGAEGIYVDFDEFAAMHASVDREKAKEQAGRWSSQTEKIVEADPKWIEKAGEVYLTTLALLKKYDTDSVTMNCLGGFAQGKLPAYPCLGFRQILDDGGQGVCEAMPDDTLAMLMARILTGRPGYVSDPVLDTSKGQIIYAHCVAATKVFGASGESNPFRIRTLHDHDPRGTCAQSFMPAGYMTTTFRTHFARKEMVIHQAKAVGNLDSPRGCRSQLVGEIQGDIGKLFSQWDHFSWHRVTVYGDVKEPLAEFGKALGLSIVEEA